MANLLGNIFSKKIKIPRTKPEELLMLMGAMYVEESNNALENIEELYEKELKINREINSWRESEYTGLKFDLIDEFCALDMHMSGGKYMSEDQLQRYLIDLVEEQERKFSFHNEKIDINLRLKDLIMSLYQTTGKKVVVLIDEYDAPLLDVAHEKEELVKLRNIMRNFFSPLKAREAYLRFVFLRVLLSFRK
jgi:hypothetical protein